MILMYNSFSLIDIEVYNIEVYNKCYQSNSLDIEFCFIVYITPTLYMIFALMRRIAHSLTLKGNFLPMKRFDTTNINSFCKMHTSLKCNCTVGMYLKHLLYTSVSVKDNELYIKIK